VLLKYLDDALKGIVNPKITILSLIIHSHLVPNP